MTAVLVVVLVIVAADLMLIQTGQPLASLEGLLDVFPQLTKGWVGVAAEVGST